MTDEPQIHLSGDTNPTQRQLPEGQGPGDSGQTGTRGRWPSRTGQTPGAPQHSLPPRTDDKLEQQHSLFTRYKDPCRLGPGEEKPWAIGELGLGTGSGGEGRGTGAGEGHCRGLIPHGLPGETCPQDLTAGEKGGTQLPSPQKPWPNPTAPGRQPSLRLAGPCPQ